METKRYKIAGHIIKVEGKNLCESIASLPGFHIFETDSSDEPVCIFREKNRHGDLVATKRDYEKLPGLKRILYSTDTDIADSCFGEKENGGYVFASYSNIEEGMLFIETDKNCRLAEISGDYIGYLLKFGCWLAFSIATLPYQTIPFHSSTILYNNSAVLFLGESGTGKSTHTRLWRENIENATMLNDDSPILRIENGKILAYGSPWSGKMHCYLKSAYPVAACVRLSQAPHNKIKRLSIHRAFAALHPSCPPEFAYDDALYDYVSEFLSQLLLKVPVYHLEALPDAAAALLSFETIFGQCPKN